LTVLKAADRFPNGKLRKITDRGRKRLDRFPVLVDKLDDQQDGGGTLAQAGSRRLLANECTAKAISRRVDSVTNRANIRVGLRDTLPGSTVSTGARPGHGRDETC